MTESPMGRPEWDRVKQIFHEAREVTGPERDAVLGALCGGDDVLRAGVEALLAADAESGDALDAPTVDEAGAAARAAARAAEALAASEPPESPGGRIGPYKLLQRIGEGGFGVVYMAEQEEPIRRRVALKVIKPGMDTKQVIARFEAERQALAMLDHPNIAKVFEAGATPAGRPYFVMELVRGIPITDYCDEHRLGTRERLKLFADVCGAVHHAHENGIIHRDIKPSNVLVTLHDGTPVPKVIDFGVAKATHQRLTESTLFTEYNQFIGTPEYMSPEQAAYEGLDVDRRSDVYSLGTLLYELLTGTTPFEARKLRRAAYVEVLRVLREEEPPKPSTRVHTLGKASEPFARSRGADPGGLARLLRGDLDWIVMKALEKDRMRRYDSASDLAADIGRYFAQKPIVARPPSAAYRARKFVRRRRVPIATAALVALGIVGETLWMGSQRARMAASAVGGGAVGGQLTALLLDSERQPCSFASARPSPDGTRMLALDYCEGGVYLHDLEAGTSELVTDREFYWGADWSPDGRRIAIGSGSAGSARLIDLATGAAEVPASLDGAFLGELRWSPDGDHLAGLMTEPNGNISTVLVSLDDAERTVLAEGVREGQGAAAFSPDGRYVVFSDVGGEDEDLFVVEVATGERWALTGGPENDGKALWSPDGRTVVYGNESGMWAIPVSGGRAAGASRLLRRDVVWPSAWTEHGYYYTATNMITRAHRIGVDPATGRATGTGEPVTLPAGDLPNVRFAWSPDMERMAVAGWTDGMIHLMKGGAVSSFPIGSEVLPTKLWWSPDGRNVLFTTSDRAQRDRSALTVSALDTDEGTVRELFPPVEGVGHLHVSPDQARMVFFRSEGAGMARHRDRRMYVADLGDRDGRPVASLNEHGRISNLYGQPTFSPDGSRILFLRNALEADAAATVPFSLWVIEADGSNERLLDETSAMIRSPVWDPTGRMAAYMARDDGEERFRLVVASVADGTTHEIEAFQELGDATLQAWSPDGAWIGVTESVGRREVWVNRDVLEGGL